MNTSDTNFEPLPARAGSASETPETDALAGEWIACECVPASHARKLEKERDEARRNAAAGSGPSGTWLAITEHLPHVGDVIACRAPNADGGLIYWAGKVIEVRPPHAVMEMRGAYTRQFVITHDTEWVSLPNSQLNQPELG
jgi:hypothetical protein